MTSRIICVHKEKDHRHVTLTFRFVTVTQLFDDSDTRPLPEKEVTELAEETMSGYVDEFFLKEPMDLVIELPDSELPPDTEALIPDAVRRHFTLLIPGLDHDLQLVKRSGLESAIIALVNAILGIFFIYYFSKGGIVQTWYTIVIGFILIIANWASFWATYEIFFYDYRSLLLKRRNYRKIISSPIRVRRYSQ